MRRWLNGREDEDGAVAVITALTLTVLLLFSAFVIDLGALRADRALNQSVADMAAAAAAQAYEPGKAGSAREACQQAVAYVNANLEDITFSDADCDEFPEDEACDPAVVHSASFEAPPYTLTVINPVPDDDDLMQSLSFGGDVDGGPCDRIGVSLQRSRDFLLAPAVGAGSSGSTQAGAVGRASVSGDLGVLASLIVLNRQACKALVGHGSGAGVRVDDFVDSDGERHPGIITVDSIDTNPPAGGCTNPKQIIRTDGGGQVVAADHIFSHQLRAHEGTENVAFGGSGTIDPTPEPGRRITRAPVDHLYNCLSSYPSDQRWSPTHPDSVSSAGSCEEAGAIPPYVSELHAAYQDLDAAPAGWGVVSGADCSGLTDHLGPGAGDVETHWFIDCTGNNGNQGFTPTDVHFDGVEAVVARGQIRLQNNGLEITGDSDTGAVLYLQNGRFTDTSATVGLHQTFVYLHRHELDLKGALTWSAPLSGQEPSCESYVGAPPAGCFAPLGLWANEKTAFTMGGSGQVTTVGSFFVPNADPFSLHGGSNSDFTRSQFFAGRIEAGGQGLVTMIPNPETNIEVPLLGGGLIR